MSQRDKREPECERQPTFASYICNFLMSNNPSLKPLGLLMGLKTAAVAQCAEPLDANSMCTLFYGLGEAQQKSGVDPRARAALETRSFSLSNWSP